ncbi:MAG: helix-turn-helix domain-containing protein [Armatimonadota bacterium]
MANYETFRIWLQEEMERRSWTFTELARQSGITVSHLTRIAGGERIPGMKTLLAIARAFRLPREEVLRHAGIIPPVRGTVAGMEELQAYYHAMTPKDRKRLLSIARSFVEDEAD